MRKRKIALIGIDGASWEVIDPLLKKGKLPWFKERIEEGLHGVLYCNVSGIFQKKDEPLYDNNIFPRIKNLPYRVSAIEKFFDPVSWTNLSTGFTPEKHGINDYTEPGPDGIEMPISRAKRKKPAIWEILAHRGKKVGVIGWMANYPPPKLDNYTIAMILDTMPAYSKGLIEKLSLEDLKLQDLGFSSLTSPTYPFSLWEILKTISPDKDAMIFIEKLLHLRYSGKVILNLILDNLHLKWMKYLLQKYPQPDFLTVCLYGIHYLSHLFWDCLDGKEEGFRGAAHQRRRKRYGHIVEEYYQYLDKKISEVTKLIDKDSIVMIVSEHGMSASCVTKRFILADQIYEKLGFLRFNNGEIDWGNTRVYDNRNPWGLFSIKKGYIKDKNPYRVFKCLKRSLEVVKTDKGKQLFPTVIFNKKENSFLVMPNYKVIKYNTRIFIENKAYSVLNFVDFIPHYSLHGPEGIVVISGKGIPRARLSSWISIVDIAPTILYLSDINYKGMDGKIIAEIAKERINEKGRFLQGYIG